MPELNLDLLKKKSLLPEIKATMEFAKGCGIDLATVIRELKKAINVAEQSPDSKLINEYLQKTRRELERLITTHLLENLSRIEKTAKDKGLESKALTSEIKSVYSAIGIKHYEMALKSIRNCDAEIARMLKPPYEAVKVPQPVRCANCYGMIKPEMPAIKCHCEKIYHEPCALRIQKCACGTEFRKWQ